MPASSKSRPADAVETLNHWRARLEVENPSFRIASQSGKRADLFLKRIKSQLKERRKALRWDQARLADVLEYSQSAVSKLESGPSDLSLRTLFRLSHALGLHPVVTFVPAAQDVQPEAASEASAQESSGMSAAAIEEVQERMAQKVSAAMSEAIVDIAQASAKKGERVLEAG